MSLNQDAEAKRLRDINATAAMAAMLLAIGMKIGPHYFGQLDARSIARDAYRIAAAMDKRRQERWD